MPSFCRLRQSSSNAEKPFNTIDPFFPKRLQVFEEFFFKFQAVSQNIYVYYISFHFSVKETPNILSKILSQNWLTLLYSFVII